MHRQCVDNYFFDAFSIGRNTSNISDTGCVTDVDLFSNLVSIVEYQTDERVFIRAHHQECSLLGANNQT